MSIFKDKTLLITGGTGSFGNAVLRRFLDSDIKEIRIFSRDEKKQDDMRHQLQNPKVKFYIGNVRNKTSVDVAMRGVDYVFSAAALKQVPSCEFFPMEATRTNVEGTENVLLSAIEHGVKNVVVLSTDKAAYPINAMGISKALMEKVAIAKGRELGEGAQTTICCTRYGNVMASRGSVLQPSSDECICRRIRFGHASGGKQFLPFRRQSYSGCVYPYQYGTSGSIGQRQLHPGRYHDRTGVAGGGCGSRDESGRCSGTPRSQLRGRECLGEGRQADPELHGCCEQDGLEKILIENRGCP